MVIMDLLNELNLFNFTEIMKSIKTKDEQLIV